jgi:hypothetical protein
MKLERRDLARLRWPLLLALVMLAAAIAGIGWSQKVERAARAERDSALQAKTQIEQRLRQVRSEEQDIKTRTQQFHAMEQAGIVGPERRLDWTEQLRDLQRSLRLPGMTYEFGPQVPLDPPAGGAPVFHASPLRVQLRLLHEEDLLNFLPRLQREARALVLVRGCKVSRLAPPAADGANLGAECTMDWITLRRPAGTRQP